MCRYVLLDVDGTLLRGPSSERLFFRHLLMQRHCGWRQLASAALFSLRWWPSYGRHVLKKNKAYLVGLSVRAVEQVAETFVQEVLATRVRPSILQRLEEHRRAGHPLALLTGTPEFIAVPLAAQLQAQHYSATGCSIRDGVFDREPPTIHPFGVEKLQQAQALCSRLGWRLSDCFAYADSAHDIPLLRAAGHPVAVYPDRRLRRVAADEGWEIIA